MPEEDLLKCHDAMKETMKEVFAIDFSDGDFIKVRASKKMAKLLEASHPYFYISDGYERPLSPISNILIYIKSFSESKVKKVFCGMDGITVDLNTMTARLNANNERLKLVKAPKMRSIGQRKH